MPIKQKWSAKYRNTPLPDSPIKRKPDIVLIDGDVDDEPIVTWRTVRAIAEITSQCYEVGKLVGTVVDKSYIMLTTQFDRVFVPILSVWGRHRFRLTVTDREGQLRSMVYELSGVRPASVSLAFLRLVVGLCFTDNQCVGYDPTMITDKFGVVKSIKCKGNVYTVVRVVYESQSFVGRATRVWVVKHNKKKFILKDTWVEKSRTVSEIEHLEHIKGMRGVPVYVCGEDVSIDGKVLCTGNIRGILLPTMRVRRRIVTSSIGHHISQFRTKRELISAFKDVTVGVLNIFYLRFYTYFLVNPALKELAEEKDTIHRDISYSNILLLDPGVNEPNSDPGINEPNNDSGVDEPNHDGALRAGLLIDFEYAARMSNAYCKSPGLRTVRVLLFSFYSALLIHLVGHVAIHGNRTAYLSRANIPQASS